uniref:Glutamate decarboxylase gad1 n=1 Tax=Sphaerodactylus townsendi TaxID=933632 RepID=A0ACB8G146_9SAUR
MLGSENKSSLTCAPCNNDVGFLQRNNSLEDKSRLVSTLKERQSSRNLLACENSEKEARFRRTETDFSNLYARDLLPAKNGEEQTLQFLLEVVDILLSYVRKTFDRSTKVLDFHHPHQLLEGMEGFNLELSDNPESLEQILVDCRDTLKYGVRTDSLDINSVPRKYFHAWSMMVVIICPFLELTCFAPGVNAD